MSFAQWYENLDQNPDSTKPVLYDNGNGDAALTLTKQEPDFWVRFAQFANSNAGELSDLLGVPIDQITKWYDKISYAMKQAEEIKAEKQPEKTIRTGQV